MLQGVPKTIFRQLVSVLGSQYRYPSPIRELGYRYPSPSIDTRCINKEVSIPFLRYRYLGALQGVPIPSLAGTDTQIPVLELVHPNKQESKVRKLLPEELEKSHNPIPGARGNRRENKEDQTLGIYMSPFGPKFNLIPN
ncbi:hypothetical protein GQ457_08G026930 [Hibiscus cannabinus]